MSFISQSLLLYALIVHWILVIESYILYSNVCLTLHDNVNITNEKSGVPVLGAAPKLQCYDTFRIKSFL